MVDVSIRAATPEDWSRVTRLVRAAELPLAGVEERLREFVVAERGGAVVGCAGLERYGHDGLLRSVVVQPDARGAGIGEALVRHLVARAGAEGVRRVWLLTLTAADYFPRIGFRDATRAEVPPPVRSSIEFREACPATATVMALDLRH